jgi:hypothetical protein
MFLVETMQMRITEFDVLRSNVEYYFSKLVNRDLDEALDVMKRLRALIDQKLSLLERKDMARRYGAVCPKCGSDEVEWIEKIHECRDCQVWVISCLECRTEWCDIVWKSS